MNADERRHDKAWNDPPMFATDEVARSTNRLPLHKRYPAPAAPVANPQSHPTPFQNYSQASQYQQQAPANYNQTQFTPPSQYTQPQFGVSMSQPQLSSQPQHQVSMQPPMQQQQSYVQQPPLQSYNQPPSQQQSFSQPQPQPQPQAQSQFYQMSMNQSYNQPVGAPCPYPSSAGAPSVPAYTAYPPPPRT